MDGSDGTPGIPGAPGMQGPDVSLHSHEYSDHP